MADEVLLTREGFEKIKEEYEHLTSVTRGEVAERLKEARAFGDLSENAEYDAAKNEQAELEVHISELEEKMRHAKIIDDEQVDRNKVNLGSKVTLTEQESGIQGTYTLVGSTEADPFNNRISNESAVGKAIIGHKAGDLVEVEIKNRNNEKKLTYSIDSID